MQYASDRLAVVTMRGVLALDMSRPPLSTSSLFPYPVELELLYFTLYTQPAQLLLNGRHRYKPVNA